MFVTTEELVPLPSRNKPQQTKPKTSQILNGRNYYKGYCNRLSKTSEMAEARTRPGGRGKVCLKANLGVE